jgi:hypothetical protein
MPCASPSGGTTSRTGTQEFSNIIWNPKVHYRIHKSARRVPVLSQMNPIHTTTSYFSKVLYSVILGPTSVVPSGFFPCGFPTKTLHSCALHALPISSSLT